MEEEITNARKYLSEILENDENTFEILLNQWKLINKKMLFKFVLCSLSNVTSMDNCISFSKFFVNVMMTKV